ncbi:MAG TPA: hypothetical protein VHC20_03270 [Candidatus Paceibacterota bacterium]|nr:hypothetical protein [Candidatus Paceibacterota bacterium]
MSTATPLYGTATALTMTLASLASDTNLVAGRSSAAVDNTSDDAVDAIVGGKVTTGTSPTASRQIEVWMIASYDGTSYSGGATGSDANFTPQSKTLLALLTIIPTTGTSNQTYTWGPFSVANAFGGVMPVKWGVYIVHNTGVALNSTGSNHEVKYMPVKYESA